MIKKMKLKKIVKKNRNLSMIVQSLQLSKKRTAKNPKKNRLRKISKIKMLNQNKNRSIKKLNKVKLKNPKKKNLERKINQRIRKTNQIKNLLMRKYKIWRTHNFLNQVK
jgi:hypothetical protein